MIQIPNRQQNQTWTQPNDSDMKPNLWATTNIDASLNSGKLGLGDRMLLNTSDTSGYGAGTSQTGMGVPIAFREIDSNTKILAITSGGKLLQSISNILAAGFTPPTPNSGSLPSNVTATSDMEYFNGYLYVAGGSSAVCTKFDTSLNFSTFTTAGGSTEKHLITYGNRMYQSANSNQVVSWDTADTVATTGQYTLRVGDSIQTRITFLRSSSNRIWVGTINTSNGKGYIYEWDGSSTQATKSYRLESSGVLSCVIKDDVPYVFDTNGNLLVWNGGTFKKLTGLNRKDNFLLYNPNGSAGSRFVHSNGMSIIKGKVCVLIDTRNYNTLFDTEETMPAGVYEYDEVSQDLKHKYALSYLDRLGVRIDNEDYGQIKVTAVGALSEFNIASTSSTRNGTFILGAGIGKDATNAITGIWYNDSNRTKNKSGSFITSKIYSPNITEVWQSVYYRYRKLLTSGDKIVVKYRIEEAEPTELTITWASTTSFTTTDANIANYAVGDEVEVLQGIGAGKCSHITAISAPVAGVYTVTVDETYTGATGTAIVRLQKWVKLGSNTQGDKNPNFNNLQLPLTATSTWIQFKVWMLFTGRMEFEDLNLQTKASQTANK